MGSLAYRSSKLGFKSSALAYNNPWVKMTKSMAQNKSGFYDKMSPWMDFDVYWPYMYDLDAGVNIINVVISRHSSVAWVAGDAVARIQAAHSHGYNYNNSLRPENYFLYQEGMTVFSRPVGVSTVTSARLWLSNAGEIFHTIDTLGTSTPFNMFDGQFLDTCQYAEFPLLNNTWLEIVISVSSSIYYVIQLNRADLATLNAQAGNAKIYSGLGSYSYMYSGSICLTLPSAVISMLNNYTGVAVDMYWNWDNAILGPACAKCLHHDNGCATHYPSWDWVRRNESCAAPWATRTALARLGDLEVN